MAEKKTTGRAAPKPTLAAVPAEGYSKAQIKSQNLSTLAALIDGRLKVPAAFPRRFVMVKPLHSRAKSHQILEIDTANVAHPVDDEDVAAAVQEFLLHPAMHAFPLAPKDVDELVCYWKRTTQSILRAAPRHLSFRSDPEVAFFRLPFDVESCEAINESTAPTWASVQARLPDFDILAMFLYRMLLPNAFRKQSFWLQGAPDAAKSVLGEALTSILDRNAISILPKQWSQDFFPIHLPGKTLIIMDECDPNFVQTDEFLRFTGTNEVFAQPKGKGYVQVRYEFFVIMFSNKAPSIRGRPEVANRIIHAQISRPQGHINRDLMREGLIREFPRLLGYARNLFERHGVDPHNGIIPEAVSRTLEDIAADRGLAFEIFERHFEITDEFSEMLKRDEVDGLLRLGCGIKDNAKRGILKHIWRVEKGVREHFVSRCGGPREKLYSLKFKAKVDV